MKIVSRGSYQLCGPWNHENWRELKQRLLREVPESLSIALFPRFISFGFLLNREAVEAGRKFHGTDQQQKP